MQKKDWRDEITNIDYKVLHRETLAKKGVPIQLQGGFVDRDTVVHEWVKAKRKDKLASNDNFILTDIEYRDFFLPHTLGTGTSLDVTPLESYWPTFLERKSFGLQKALDTLTKSSGRIKKLNWRAETRTYGPWQAWKLDSVVLQPNTKGEDIVIEELKLVACYRETCKIAVIAP